MSTLHPVLSYRYGLHFIFSADGMLVSYLHRRQKLRAACTPDAIRLKKIMRLILFLILILLIIAALPTWPYSTGWGYYPSGGVGLILLIVLLVVLLR
jgi:Protein of unknown function (DUF3309)